MRSRSREAHYEHMLLNPVNTCCSDTLAHTYTTNMFNNKLVNMTVIPFV